MMALVGVNISGIPGPPVTNQNPPTKKEEAYHQQSFNVLITTTDANHIFRNSNFEAPGG